MCETPPALVSRAPLTPEIFDWIDYLCDGSDSEDSISDSDESDMKN